MFVIRFYKNNSWVYVVTDDKFPVDADGNYIYSHCKNDNEIWVNMIEKAYAKLHQSYQNLISGDIS